MASKEEARQILRTGFGRQLYLTAANYVAPVFWGESRSEVASPIINNGSIFFLNCGGPTLAVTAHHVYAGYLARKKYNPNIACQIGNLNFNPESRLIDFDPELDIATFRITENEVATLDKTIHCPPQSKWPPPPPVKGKGVFFCGFAASGRAFRGRRSLDFETYFAALTADSITAHSITSTFRREDWLDMEGNDSRGQDVDLGGISGAPMWALTQSPQVLAWRLAGIIIQFNPSFEILIARRPDCIRADGTLARTN